MTKSYVIGVPSGYGVKPRSHNGRHKGSAPTFWDSPTSAAHLEPEPTEAPRMYRRLWQALTALMPILLEAK
jgi:hypothetical protein